MLNILQLSKSYLSGTITSDLLIKDKMSKKKIFLFLLTFLMFLRLALPAIALARKNPRQKQPPTDEL